MVLKSPVMTQACLGVEAHRLGKVLDDCILRATG